MSRQYLPKTKDILKRTFLITIFGFCVGCIFCLLIGSYIPLAYSAASSIAGLLLFTRRVTVENGLLTIYREDPPIPVASCTAVVRTKSTFLEIIRRLIGRSTNLYLLLYVSQQDGEMAVTPLTDIGFIAKKIAEGIGVPFEIRNVDDEGQL